jgi:hypothetical protein
MGMNEQSKKLVERLKAFDAEVVAFVEGCREADWGKMCAPEDWTVGVTARHIGAGHYDTVDLIKMIVAGEKLPDMTEEEIVRMANDHAAKHADCTKEEVLEVFRTDAPKLLDYISRLDDAALGKTGYFSLLEKDVSAQQFVETVILWSGGEHFASMKRAVAA